jgi:phage shock protein E
MRPFALIVALIATAAFVAMSEVEARAELSETEAREYVKHGVLIVDVRTVGEFNTRHLTNVVNIPLAEVKQKLPGMLTNKSEVVLLHCRTGRRSGIAEGELRALGYTNVFNIGSFERAQKILTATDRR